MLPVLINSPAALALRDPDRAPAFTADMEKGEKESLVQSKHRSGGAANFSALLSSAQDLVQTSGHEVGPGGRAVVPLQVLAWNPDTRGADRAEHAQSTGQEEKGNT